MREEKEENAKKDKKKPHHPVDGASRWKTKKKNVASRGNVVRGKNMGEEKKNEITNHIYSIFSSFFCV